MEWLNLKWFFPKVLGSFSWEYPFVLIFLILIPALFYLRWYVYNRRKNKISLNFPTKDYPKNYTVYLRHLITGSIIFGLICCVLALARPQIISELKSSYSEGIDIMIAMDISDSMLGRDLSPNRLEAAKQVAIEFIKGRDQDRIGLVAFAGESTTLAPLTTDYEMLIELLNNLKSSFIPTAGTAIGNALASSINGLRDVPGKTKVIILLSDGSNSAGNLDPITGVNLANFFGIKIYTIAVGKNSDVELLNEASLTEIAKKSNGKFFKASDNETLSKIFGQINQLEKRKVKNEYYSDVKDYYYNYLYWAIFSFLTALFLKSTYLGNILED